MEKQELQGVQTREWPLAYSVWLIRAGGAMSSVPALPLRFHTSSSPW